VAIVSDERKWVFIHIPKSAGTSISHFLWSFLGPADFAIEAYPDSSAFPVCYGIEKHAKAARYVDWMDGTGRDWNLFTSFAVIRDPMSRPRAVFREIHRQLPAMKANVKAVAVSSGSLWPWWGCGVSDQSRPVSAASAWIDGFERLSGVDEFILSGMYDPGGPLTITHSQRSFISSEKGAILVKHLFLMDEVSRGVPLLLGLPGIINRINVSPDKPLGDFVMEIGRESQDHLHRVYAEDYDLVEGMSE
jgi:hypothetical protein